MTGKLTGDKQTPEGLAQLFHEAYERLAPKFDYKTQEASAVPWADVPVRNRQLMTAVCAEILQSEAPRKPLADSGVYEQFSDKFGTHLRRIPAGEVSHLLGKYLNTMVADLCIEDKGQYLRDLFSKYEAELREFKQYSEPAPRLMRGNLSRPNTPHYEQHQQTMACHAPPKCKPSEHLEPAKGGGE